MNLPKISMVKLENQDISVIADACSRYSKDLGSLKELENRAQQHIHFTILQVLRFELLKKMTSRSPAKKCNLNMEIFSAFVVYDALQHYSNHCDNQLDQAIMRRLIFQLFAELPNTSDKELSVNSKLNFEY